MARGYFVCGTDTGVGKTLIARSLLVRLNDLGYSTAAMKPVACGCRSTIEGLRNDDAVQLMNLASAPTPYEQVNPYPLQRPIAPNLAADEQGLEIKVDAIIGQFQKFSRSVDFLIVEGVGGWMVPLSKTELVADMARAMALPVILVVAIRLGCISHALLTAAAIQTCSQLPMMWIANMLEPDTNAASGIIDTLRERIPYPLVGIVPYAPSGDVDLTAGHIDMRAVLAATR